MAVPVLGGPVIRLFLQSWLSRVYAHAPVHTFNLSEFLQTPARDGARESPGRKIQVRRSGVHGKGVFAVQDIPEGETLIEYVGEIISWEEAQRRHPHDPDDPNHTFYFHVDDDRVIDALHGGNSSRWINHSCDPNCDAVIDDGRVYIESIRDIEPGEEITYDYNFILPERHTPALKRRFPCICGAPGCRGTILAKKR